MGLRGLGAAIGRRITPVRPDLADAAVKTAPLRLLIFCERLAASQQVHLLRPLKRARAEGRVAVAVISEMALPKRAHKQRALDHLWKTWRPDAVIMSRFAGPQTADVLAKARAHDTPVIAHLDDFLFEIPAELGRDKLHQHGRPQRIEALRAVFEAAAVQFISTQPLADKIATLGFKAPVYVPAVQSGAEAGELAALPPAREAVTIGYQGTQNHKLDLEMIVPALAGALDARPNARLELFGTIAVPEALDRFGERVTRRAAQGDYEAFLDQLKALRWDLGLAPLRDTEYNGFRTHTKWVEYGVAGVPTLASDSPPYRDVCDGEAGLLASDWTADLIALIDDAPRRRAVAAAAQAAVRQRHTLAQMEAQVMDVMRMAGVPLSSPYGGGRREAPGGGRP